MDDAQLVSPADGGRAGPDRPKTLVFEDAPDIRKIIEIFLTEKRFHVKVTDGAPAALEMLDQEPIDVILSDVRMPEMSGLELLRHLKERDPDIQLVLMSAYSSVTDAVEAIQLGAADYVEKPIDFRRLERVLQSVLEKRHLEHRTRILEQRLQGCVTSEGIGSPDPIRIDIRVIAATNRDLADMVRQGAFRDDLYYRLNVGAIHLPPLRSRADDVEPLARHFIAAFNEKLGRSVSGLTPHVLEILTRYPWPGNVRELANVLERAMVVCKGSVLLPENLPPHLFETHVQRTADGQRLPELSLEAAEREQILRALQAAGGKRVEAARLLGLSRRTLYRKLDRYGIA